MICGLDESPFDRLVVLITLSQISPFPPKASLLARRAKFMELIDRLAEHKALGSAPREELAWLAKNGSLRRLEPGEVISHKGKMVDGLYIVLSGHISLSVERATG